MGRPHAVRESGARQVGQRRPIEHQAVVVSRAGQTKATVATAALSRWTEIVWVCVPAENEWPLFPRRKREGHREWGEDREWAAARLFRERSVAPVEPRVNSPLLARLPISWQTPKAVQCIFGIAGSDPVVVRGWDGMGRSLHHPPTNDTARGASCDSPADTGLTWRWLARWCSAFWLTVENTTLPRVELKGTV